MTPNFFCQKSIDKADLCNIHWENNCIPWPNNFEYLPFSTIIFIYFTDLVMQRNVDYFGDIIISVHALLYFLWYLHAFAVAFNPEMDGAINPPFR